MKKLTRMGMVLVLSIAAPACSAPYLLRAAYEEVRILWRREPIAEVLARGEIDAATREKLSLVLAARRFATNELGFAVGKSYSTVARVDGDAVVHVVTAAYRNRLEPYTWRYPIIGKVPYRGFFDPGSAETYAEKLEAMGLDTAVWRSAAFSTLGWFADPLLSNMLQSDPLELVTVVLHELTHAQVYVPSAAEFNESLANFVGHRGAISFFCDAAAGNHAARPVGMESKVAERCERARVRWRNEREYGAALARAAEALRKLYAATLPRNQRSRRRSEILSTATRSWEHQASTTTPYRDTDFVRFNNAVFLQQVLYRSQLDLFEDAWKSQGEDLGRTLRKIARAVRMGGEPFAAVGDSVCDGPLADRGRGAGGAAGGGRLVFEAPEEVIRAGNRCVDGDRFPVLADDAGDLVGWAELVMLSGDDRDRA